MARKSLAQFAILLAFLVLCSSPAQAQGFVPPLPVGVRSAWLDLGTQPLGWGLILCVTDAVPVRWEKHLGSEGILPAKNSPDPSIYLSVAPGFLLQPTGTFYLGVEYWDAKHGTFLVEYPRDTESATPTVEGVQTKRFYTGGTKRWQRENLAITDARLTQNLLYGADFRLIPPEIPIRRVFLSRIPLGEVDRVQPLSAAREVVKSPDSLEIMVRPTSQERLFGDLSERIQLFDLYASWGAKAVTFSIDRSELLKGMSYRDSPVTKWDSLFQDQSVPILLEIALSASTDTLPSLWDRGEFERWERAAKSVSLVTSGRWLHGVVLCLDDVAGMAPDTQLDLALSSPIVRQDFRKAVHDEIGFLSKVNAQWGVTYRGPDQVIPFRSGNAPSPQAALFANSWLRKRQTDYLNEVLRIWRSHLGNSSLYIRIPCEVGWGTPEPAEICRIAQNHGAIVQLIYEKGNPITDPGWQLWAAAAQRTGVQVSLDIECSEPRAVPAAIFALSESGGTGLTVSEDQIALQVTPERFKSLIRQFQNRPSIYPVAALYPRTSTELGRKNSFAEWFAELRDAVPIDLVDERDLSDPSALSKYRVLFHLGGEVWSKESLNGLNEWVRLGNLFVCAGDDLLVDLSGDTAIMPILFPLQIHRDGTLRPVSQQMRTVDVQSPFSDLRARWSKEVGQGFTLYVPSAARNPQAYMDLLAAIAQDPALVARRLGQGVRGDGGVNGFFVTGIGREEMILNCTPDPVTFQPGAGKSIPLTPWELQRFKN
ncbi:MAG TPA: hypothetical protein PLY86_07550 [bacterium]|nr:hypothetical protein [bacterium]